MRHVGIPLAVTVTVLFSTCMAFQRGETTLAVLPALIVVVSALGLVVFMPRYRLTLISCAALGVFVMSFRYWFDSRPLPGLLVTLPLSVVIAGGTLLHILRGGRAGLVAAVLAGLASLPVSYTTWMTPASFYEHVFPGLFTVFGAALVATVGSILALFRTMRPDDTGLHRAGPPSRRTLVFMTVLVPLLVIASVVVQSESRSHAAQAGASLECDTVVHLDTGELHGYGEGAYSPTPVGAIRAAIADEPTIRDFATIKKLGPRYGEGTYEMIDDQGAKVGVAWLVQLPGDPGGFGCREIVACTRW